MTNLHRFWTLAPPETGLLRKIEVDVLSLMSMGTRREEMRMWWCKRCDGRKQRLRTATTIDTPLELKASTRAAEQPHRSLMMLSIMYIKAEHN